MIFGLSSVTCYAAVTPDSSVFGILALSSGIQRTIEVGECTSYGTSPGFSGDQQVYIDHSSCSSCHCGYAWFIGDS